ncbi:MAG TPA: LamG domain-containing protein, partial [Thermoguttaceae bacterium]|nr:LamG domain-containing protein [Thermoguttaceae bacterium]
RLVLSAGVLGGLASAPMLHSPGTVDFDGVDDLLQFADQPEFNTNQYTIALWFNAADAAAGTQTLIARGEDWAHDKAQWVVELNDKESRGKVQLWYEDANDRDHYFATETSIEGDQWYHLAVTRSDAGEVTMYLDAEVELQATDPVKPASVETPVTVGARRNSPNKVQDYFDGALHEVAVFDSVLSAEAIDELMEQTRPEDCWVSDRIEISEIGSDVDIAMHDDGSFVATWMQIVDESEEIFARRFDAQGNPRGERIAVNLTTMDGQLDPAVAARPDGGFVVVWASQLPDSEAIYARLFDADGVPIGGELFVGLHDAAYYGRPDVSVDGLGNFVVVWNGRRNDEGVLVRRFDSDGAPLSEAVEVSSPLPSYGWSQVAMNEDGWFVVTSPHGEWWSTTTLMTFDPNGEMVSSRELESYQSPSLALNDDGLLVVSWVGSYPEQPIGDRFALYAQVYSVLGHEVGPQVMVSPGKAGNLDWGIYESDVAINDESFVVTWKDYDFGEDNSHGEGVYSARFDLEGNPLGEELELGIYAREEYELAPAVAMNENDAYVVAWQRRWSDGVFAKTVHCPPIDTTGLPDPLLSIEQRHEFDGVDDYLTVEQENLNINEYTVGFWFKADDPGDGEQTLIARGEDANDKAQWIVRINTNENPGKLELWYEDANDRDAVFAGTTTIPGGQWTYATVTRSADGQVQIFLNGALELSASSLVMPVSTETPVLIGARMNAPNKIQEYFDGSIDNITVYDEVLSAYQINHLMASTAHDQQPQAG